MVTDAEKKIRKARAHLVAQYPFYGALALRLRLAEAPAGIDTAAVDGTTLFYHPPFFDGLTVPETIAVVAHEVMHVALGHIFRLRNRNAGKWNRACDYAINLMLEESRFTLPKCGLIDKAYAGMSADEIYAKLPDDPENDGKGDPGGMGGMLEPTGEDGSQLSPADLKRMEQEAKIATIQAANSAKAAGNLPGAIRRMVEELKRPQVDWRAVLREFILSRKPSDYSWMPPNRRYVASGLYLPGIKSDLCGPIAVFVDTSGSISDKILQTFASELNAIVGEAKPEAVHVAYCDHRLGSTHEYRPDDYPIRLQVEGGGGTSFKPPFAWVEREGIEPVAGIYLTDMYGDFPDAAPDYPFLWVSTGGHEAPFGKVIRIEE